MQTVKRILALASSSMRSKYSKFCHIFCGSHFDGSGDRLVGFLSEFIKLLIEVWYSGSWFTMLCLVNVNIEQSEKNEISQK